ncbi:chitin synthase-domain-containing protein [Mycotypha africana]|uniref:chitin synthase-domain-containing protein n=1 Tax=Mycotypha africana TaxID=64632 RepID=UPI0023010963|nr:chitin synthase-domain-containing protein [Mycotypha africana]KAI8977542.1 chitin synthase-domain-containing protein [Mycotypha africana]
MQEESHTDLVSLYTNDKTIPTEEAVAIFLENRYRRNLPYTQLGYSTLVVVNPYQTLELLNDDTLRSYAEIGYKDLTEQRPSLQPHVYDLATKVYFHMRRTGEDQSVILSGITGSGKSTTRTHFLCELLQLSTHNKRENKLSSQIQNALVIIEAFGHAHTTQNVSASKFGMFQEIQFNERGRILGTKTLAYQFDKSRVTQVPPNERTYHVFYSLLAGTTVEEKNALHINFKPEYFNYLNQSSCNIISTSDWNDETEFSDLKSALKMCGFKAKTVTQIFQLLAAVLHIGNIQFIENADTQAQEACVVKNYDALDKVAMMLGVSSSKLETCLTYKLKLIGKEVCTIFLNPQTAGEQRDSLACALYNILFLWIIESINRKICYSNTKEPANVIGIMDQFGFQNFKTNGFQEFCVNLANERIHHFLVEESFGNNKGLNELMINDGVPLPTIPVIDNSACLELLFGKTKKQLVDDAYNKQEIFSNSSSLGLGGIVGLMDRDTARQQSGVTDATNANFLVTLQRQHSSHTSLCRGSQTFSFGINHFSGTVHYTADQFLERNLDELSPDFVNLLRDSSSNAFISNLFQGSAMATESHPKDDRTIVKAQLSSKPTRAPTLKRKPTKHRNGRQPQTANNGIEEPIPSESNEHIDDELKKQIKKPEEAYENLQQMTVTDQLYMTLRDIIFSMADTKLYNIIHIRPNDIQAPEFDHNRVQTQVRAFLIPELIVRHHYEFAYYYTFEEFTDRYEAFINSLSLEIATETEQELDSNSEKEKIKQACQLMKWNQQNVFVGQQMVWLSYDIWKGLEDGLRLAEKREREELKMEAMGIGGVPSVEMASEKAFSTEGQPYFENHPDYEEAMYDRNHLETADDAASYGYSEDKRDIDGSQWGEESEWGINGLAEGFGPNMDMSKMVEDIQAPKIENVEEVPITRVRRWWVRFVWLMTFWIPSPFLAWFGKMKRPDIQMAWREKVTLCMLIGLFSFIVLFFIVGLGPVVCPGTSTMYSISDVQAHNVENDNYMSVRGNVYDMTQFAKTSHGSHNMFGTPDAMAALAGQDVSSSIPPPLTVACSGLVTNDNVRIIPNTTNSQQASFIHYSGGQVQYSFLNDTQDPYWYWKTFLPRISEYKKGTLVHRMKDLKADADSWGRAAMAMYNKVYDLQDYFTTIDTYAGASVASEYKFLSGTVEDLFTRFKGTDATKKWEMYKDKMSVEEQEMNMNCLDNYFLIGYVDPRDTPRCTFSNYLLLAMACVMCAVILVKFLASLQFGSTPTPEDHDKFVICQVPCYTEDEVSLKKTIDSLTVLKYDDKRKLLFLIADGMVMGSGNDRPTPRILLDILGYDTKQDPEPLMFKSVGEGAKQLNYGKVYSGLYEHEGHVVPYIVVAKVGKASERAKPGNRGKRDSQMILMNFLNRVHFDSEMTPLELEMYHQIKNVIGVNPSFYEYILMVDSDTEVMPHSLSYLISSMLHDARIMGICGETTLANEQQSWTTMIQVYEYYISHYLAKSFESLFGSVTCLPGCFCMYRVRTPVKNEPLIISPNVVHDYAENHVDTLHKKNLLSLGEDRYLTTLMMKYFPQHKMKFTPHAMCRTVAPDKWRVLLSQRRRWINSTIHNLLEVVLLNDLCGFCLFSMRFVVLIDLIGTLTLPVSFCYLIYLIYTIAAHAGPFPTLAIGMLAGLYALQILVFMLRREWQHIGWMFFYLLALPVYAFLLPVYSFWHFDDFSWGNTRVVVGDSQRKIIVADDEKFDEKMIPMKKWSVYEQELWEMGSSGSRITGYTGNSFRSRQTYGSRPPMNMMYGNRSQFGGSQIATSQIAESQIFADYDYYRDTNAATPVNGRYQNSMQRPVSPMNYAGSVISHSSAEYDTASRAMNSQDLAMHRISQAMSIHSYGPNYVNNGYLTPMMGDASYIMNQDRNSMLTAQQQQPLIGGNQSDFDPPTRPMSNFSFPSSQDALQPMMPPGFPSDEDILSEIKIILQTANLMSITKKQVREQLSAFFGFDMTPKKEFINTSIEYILQGSL